MNPQKTPGLQAAVRRLELDLDVLDERARQELSHPTTRIIGKIRQQMLKECRLSLKLIDLGYRFGKEQP